MAITKSAIATRLRQFSDERRAGHLTGLGSRRGGSFRSGHQPGLASGPTATVTGIAQHVLDVFSTPPAIEAFSVRRQNRRRTVGTTGNRLADLTTIDTVADTDDHDPINLQMRMIVNRLYVAGRVEAGRGCGRKNALRDYVW